MTFRVEQELIDVTRNAVEDPKWDFCDDEGHVHKWVWATNGAVDIPTCIRVTDVPSTEFHAGRWHWECRECGEDIEPRYYQPGRQTAMGLRSYYINEEEVSLETYEKTVKEVTAACQ